MRLSKSGLAAGAALFAAAFMVATSASAAVTYDFSGNFQEGNYVPPNASFRLTVPTYITSDQTFTASQVGLNCGDAFVQCTSVTFSTDVTPGQDVIEINFVGGTSGSAFYDFASGAFTTSGSHFQDAQPFGNNATLAVAVPEAPTWAMMISGFGLAGLALRGKRRVVRA
jgi:hypothetical protein